MARYRGPACKLCRREGMKLYLKGSRCLNKDKCSFEDRKNPPGLPPKRKPKMSEYNMQLREKQKVKRIYGVLEKPFRAYYEQAAHLPGVTGEILLQFLEKRLDNVVYRTGLASSRQQARTMISHGHITVNDHKVDKASFQVKVGDKVGIEPGFRSSAALEENIRLAQSLNKFPGWIEVNLTDMTGEITKMPEREDVDLPIKEQVIVELYSK